MAMTACVGEGVHQLDLLGRERLTDGPYKCQHANGCPFAEKGDAKHGAITFEPADLQFVFGVIANIVDVNGSGFQQRAADARTAAWPQRHVSKVLFLV